MSTPEQTILSILKDQEDPLTSGELADCSGFTQTEVLKALGELSKTNNISKSIAGYKLLGTGSVTSSQTANTKASTEPTSIADTNNAEMPKPTAPLRQLLVFFTLHNKSFMPKAIREQLQWQAGYTKQMLNIARDSGLISYKNSGFYYLTTKGIAYIKQHFPAVEIKPYVLDKVREHSLVFTVAPESARAKGLAERAAKLAQGSQTNVKKDPPVGAEHPAIAQARNISKSLKLADTPVRKLPELSDVPVKIQVMDELAMCFGNEVQIQLQQLSGFLKEYTRA